MCHHSAAAVPFLSNVHGSETLGSHSCYPYELITLNCLREGISCHQLARKIEIEMACLIGMFSKLNLKEICMLKK